MNLPGLAAVDGFEQIVALMQKSVELGQQQRWAEALACLDQGVALNPQLPLCHVDRARVLFELQRYEEALDDVDFFLRQAGQLPEILALRQEMLDGALAVLGSRLTAWPDDIAALLQRGNLFMKSRCFPEALADFSAILARDAGHVDALNNLGSVLFALNRYAAAIDAYSTATIRAPQRAELWFNLGNVRQAQGALEEAQSAYRQAIARMPDFAEAHLEMAHCLLAEGNFRAGWPQFEWRWRTAQLRGEPLPSRQPLWLGGKALPVALGAGAGDGALAGKTILLWAEQGAGDTLQFVRLVPRLLAEAGRVILRVPASLRRLLEGLDQRIEVVGDDQPPPFHDVHCPLLSLPLALGVEDLPALSSSAPYLQADPGAIARWRERLGEKGGWRIGLAWAGRQYGLINSTRDVPLALLSPLAAIEADWISLQVPPVDGEALRTLPGLRCCSAWIEDYADTAALIMNLDLVISADTGVAHLAGALGKPCWLMLRHSGEWRWLLKRSDSPWYPGMRLFRQSVPGDWDGVIAQIAQALRAEGAALAACSGPPASGASSPG